MRTSRTAFPQTEVHVRELARSAQLDRDAFEQKLRRCDLVNCQGTCCHDGVYLGEDEARVIGRLARERADFFNDETGIDLSDEPIIQGNWRNEVVGRKTATREEAMSEKVEDYPEHFADTQCVFMMEDRRCSLQLLAEKEGRHRWFYKPFTCWMHPLSITRNAKGKPVITLHSRESDPHRFSDYDGFVSRTHCGRVEVCGEPAREVLHEEIEMLSEISGRNLVAELRGDGEG